MITVRGALGPLSLSFPVWFGLPLPPWFQFPLCPSPPALVVVHTRGLPFPGHIWRLLPQAQNRPLCKQGLREQDMEKEAKSRKLLGPSEQ